MGKIEQTSVFERYPKLTSGILIFVMFIALDVLAAYLFSTLGLYSPQFKIEQHYRIKDKYFHHTLAQNITHSDAKWGPMGYQVDTNSLGFKDNQSRKISLKGKNSRLLIIGDSFTEGVGYKFDDTFAGIIAKKLKPKNIDVFNAGVSSYSPIIYYRKVKYLIDQGFEFDHLLVLIDISDIEDEAKHYMFDENGNVVSRSTAKENEIDEKFKRFIAEHTIISSSLRTLIHNFKHKHPNKRKLEDGLNQKRGMWTISEKVYNEYGVDGVTLAKEHMIMLENLLNKKNIKLSVAVYPWPDQIYHKDLHSKQVTIWQEWAKKYNADFINLFPEFINSNDAKSVIQKYYITGDVHWNQDGHKLIAKSLLGYIDK